jgi:hypothetical protein
MKKYQLATKEVLEEWKIQNRISGSSYITFCGVHEDDFKNPVAFPCILVISEGREAGWEENDFVYPNDF